VATFTARPSLPRKKKKKAPRPQNRLQRGVWKNGTYGEEKKTGEQHAETREEKVKEQTSNHRSGMELSSSGEKRLTQKSGATALHGE